MKVPVGNLLIEQPCMFQMLLSWQKVLQAVYSKFDCKNGLDNSFGTQSALYLESTGRTNVGAQTLLSSSWRKREFKKLI